jgi:hypothetical protein
MTDFKEGDMVVASGYTDRMVGKKENHHSLAKVKAVGKHDLFLESFDYRVSKKIFKLSKNRCTRVNIDSLNLRSETVKPKIGDIVLSYVEDFGRTPEKLIGMLVEIEDKPNRKVKVKLRVGDKEHIVNYNSLIVIE